jgi:hypothetical protein
MAKYAALWKDFYASSEKFFLPNSKKYYFVFTDEDDVIGKYHNVYVYHQESLGNWVQNAMFRFQAFLDHQKDFEICDYVYFFNANILFKRKVHVKEFIPTEKDGYLLALAPTLYRGHHKDTWPYERRPESQAFIPYGQGNYYFQSAIFGGRFKEFATLCKTCYDWIQIDAKNNVIARIVDESHVNKYLLDKKVKALNSNYGRWEVKPFYFPCKILLRDKYKVMGDDLMKVKSWGKTEKFSLKRYSVLRFFRKTLNRIVFYFEHR